MGKSVTSSCLCDCSSLDVAVPRSSPSALSPSIHHASPSSGSSYLLVSSLLGLLRNGRHKELIPPLLVSPQRTGCLSRTLHRTGTLIPLLGHEGRQGTPHIQAEQPHKWERATLLPKTLRLWAYGSSYL